MDTMLFWPIWHTLEMYETCISKLKQCCLMGQNLHVIYLMLLSPVYTWQTNKQNIIRQVIDCNLQQPSLSQSLNLSLFSSQSPKSKKSSLLLEFLSFSFSVIELGIKAILFKSNHNSTVLDYCNQGYNNIFVFH